MIKANCQWPVNNWILCFEIVVLSLLKFIQTLAINIVVINVVRNDQVVFNTIKYTSKFWTNYER